jgi:membrane protein insertase Oxa1/YidC/SpoIIIJ
MTGIFFNFASGLNLYYATANIATIPQQYLIAKERKALKEGPASGQLKHKDP